MLKYLKRNALTIMTSVIAFIAMTGVGINSVTYLYEPEVPESLKK